MDEYTVNSSATVLVGSNERICVLHVDDDSTFLETARECLEMESPLHVDTANSVAEALTKLEKGQYDVIVSDYQMPEKDGLQFLDELRANGNDIPFIMFTGKGREEIAIKALNLGADQYLNKTGDPATVYCELTHSIRQVVGRKKAEEKIRQSEGRYRNLFELAPDALLTLDINGIITSCNAATLVMSGYSREELIGQHFSKLGFLRMKDFIRYHALFASIEKGKLAKSLQVTWHRKDGISVFSELTIGPLTEHGKNAGVQVIARDITERKKAEEELRDSEERYRELFESIRDPVSIYVGKEGHLIGYNTAFKELFGYTDEELKSKVFLDLVHHDDQAMVLQKYQTKYAAEEFPIVYEIRVMNKKGESIPLEISVSPYKRKGRFIGIEVVHRDITERTRYEESLSALNTHGRDLNMAKSIEEVYELTLDAAEKTLGFEFADVLMVEGETLRVRAHRGYLGNLSLELPLDGDKGVTVRAVKIGKPVNVPDISKDGAYVGVGLHMRSELAVPIKIGYGVLGILNAEREKLDAFSEKDQGLLEILASHAATAISNLNHASEVKAYTRSLSALNTHGRDLNMAKSIEEVYELTLDAAEKTLGFEFADVLMVEGETLRVRAQRGDVENLSLGLPLDGDKGITVRAARTGKPVNVPDISKDDAYVSFRSQTHVCSEIAVPIKIGPRVIGVLNVESVKLDAFDEKDQELLEILASHAAAAMSNLDRAQKLDALNEKLRIVGGLTRHDVRNKLSSITGNAYLLKKRLAGNRETFDNLEEIGKAVQQATRIFDFARAYEMLGAEELVYTDVEKTVKEANSLFANQNNIKVINDCHGLTVLADSLLRELFYNLIDNSMKYGQKTSTIRVIYEKTGQDSLNLVYEDDGVGIPVHEKPRLFTKGYSTGGSTGYGLYLIKKIIEFYGWTIQETGTPGRGAQFTITIAKVNKHGKENYRIA
jgi:PAS domain S-box-containing protein